MLDANVISEMMRPTPTPAVIAYLRRCPPGELFIPSLVLGELRFGLARLPVGKRRADLQGRLDAVLSQGFSGRVLAFDAAGADGYATARAERLRLGRPVAPVDAMIGGMALACSAILVTRNTGDFDGYGLTLVDPWQTP